MTQPDDLATTEQLEELRRLAPDDEIPDGMRNAEAEQRLVELRGR